MLKTDIAFTSLNSSLNANSQQLEIKLHCCTGWWKMGSLRSRLSVNGRPGWSADITIDTRDVPE